MKFLIPFFLFFSIISAHSQEIDKLYYILGFNDDLSFPLNYSGKGKSKSTKMGFSVHESDLGKVFRFSEVTGFKFKKSRAEKYCFNCHQFYNFNRIPAFYKLENFYDFKYSKVIVNYYEFGEFEEEKQQGFLKPSILTNATQLQMKSFLAGAYLDAGLIKGDTIKLQYESTQNQKLIVIKDFISKIEEVNFFSIIERKDRLNFPDFVQGQTVVFVPNKMLLDLFRNEEERKKQLLSNYNNAK